MQQIGRRQQQDEPHDQEDDVLEQLTSLGILAHLFGLLMTILPRAVDFAHAGVGQSGIDRDDELSTAALAGRGWPINVVAAVGAQPARGRIIHRIQQAANLACWNPLRVVFPDQRIMLDLSGTDFLKQLAGAERPDVVVHNAAIPLSCHRSLDLRSRNDLGGHQ